MQSLQSKYDKFVTEENTGKCPREQLEAERKRQSTFYTESKDSPSPYNSMLMEAVQIVNEEARLTGSKVDLLKSTVQTLQWKQMLMEKNLLSSRDVDSMNDKQRCRKSGTQGACSCNKYSVFHKIFPILTFILHEIYSY